MVANWRIGVFACRIAQQAGDALPDDARIERLTRRLIKSGDLSPIKGIRTVFRVDSPYASTIPFSDQQVVQEANPWAVFSHVTALIHHNLTDLTPKLLYATHYPEGNLTRTPLGTTPEDWLDVPFPTPHLPKMVGSARIVWMRRQAAYDFGHTVSQTAGQPLYVTDLERTLLDALQRPDRSGGILKVFEAWRDARSQLSPEKLVQYVDRINSPILRQRVGFLLQRLGIANPSEADWKSRLQRGGSLKLISDEPYASTYSEDWNLSINVPESVLTVLTEAND